MSYPVHLPPIQSPPVSKASLWGPCAKSLYACVQGFPEKDITKLEDYGFIASRPRGEYHANNQQMAKLLHKAIGLGGKKAGPMVRHPSAPQGRNHFN